MTRKMKDSGVEWIGEVPENWKIVKIKHIKSKEKNSFVDGPFGSNLKSEHFVDNGDVYVIESNFATKGILIEDKLKTITFEHFNTISRSEAKENDIIIAKIGENYGSARILPHLSKKAVVSGNSLKLTLDNELSDINYICYCLVAMRENDVFKLLVNGTGQPALSLRGINNLKLTLPTIKEQKQIGEFLNINCNKIEQTIEKEKQIIEKLKKYKQSVITEAVTKGLNLNVKMKDSGIGWIGEIPEHWNCIRFKYLVSIKDGLVDPRENEYSNLPHIGPGNIEKFTGKLLSFKTAKEEGLISGKYLFNEDDIIYGKINPQLGKVAFPKFIGLCSADAYALSTNKDLMVSRYLYYSLLSKNFLYYTTSMSLRTGMPKINREELSGYIFKLPPIKEQEEIIDYLDRKCSYIDKLISDKEKIIEKLTEYKKSLIYECVTGKREVK